MIYVSEFKSAHTGSTTVIPSVCLIYYLTKRHKGLDCDDAACTSEKKVQTCKLRSCISGR